MDGWSDPPILDCHPLVLPMRFPRTPHSGTTPMTTDTATTPNTSTVKHGAHRIALTVVAPHRVNPPLTAGAAQTATVMAGPTRPPYWLASPGGSGDAWPEDPTQWHDSDGDGRGTTARDHGRCVPHGGRHFGRSFLRRRPLGLQGHRRRWLVGPWRCVHSRAYAVARFGWRRIWDRLTGHQGDACPEMRGTSLLDRLGCRDTDGDGWSDPTDAWPLIRSGWPTPSLRNPCSGKTPIATGLATSLWVRSGMTVPDVQGSSERDLQGCPDANGDGWSDEYGEFAAAVAIMGEDPAASWLTYAVIAAGFLLGHWCLGREGFTSTKCTA